MISRRRLSLQLTPLLDLLLIVMFSQYIENRSRTAQAAQELQAERDAVQAELASQKQRLDGLKATYDARYQSLLQQHRDAGSLLARALDLPAAALNEVLRMRGEDRPEDAQRLEQAVARLRTELDRSGEDVFRFFIKVDEMQKHITMWEIHLQENGKCLLQDDSRQALLDFTSDTELAQKLFESSKSFADPHSLVLMLVTWGDAQLGDQQQTRKAVAELKQKLERDAAGRHLYDYVILGFRPAGPVITPAAAPR
ncbi:MAG: hypothetical protein ACK48Y_03535 [Planctomyces sp.]|jgi:hypothetical protein